MRFASLMLLASIAAVGTRTSSTSPVIRPSAIHASTPDSFLVSTAWLAAHLHDPHVVILQVDMGMSDDAPFASAHIPGARELPSSAITVDRDGLAEERPSVDALRNAFEGVGISDSSRMG